MNSRPRPEPVVLPDSADRPGGPGPGPGPGPDAGADAGAGAGTGATPGRTVTAADVALAELHGDAEQFSPLGGRPMLVVDGEHPAAVAVGLLGRRLPCVCVAVVRDPRNAPNGLAAAGFDILLTETPDAPAPWVSVTNGIPAAVSVLGAAVSATPFAAVALAQLLRVSAGIDVRDAVVAESFAYSALQSGPEFAGWLAARRERELARSSDRPAEPFAAAKLGETSDPADRSAETGPAAVGEGPAVLVERDGGTLTVVLNRPRVHNAVSIAVRDGLVAAFGLAGADPEVTEIRLAGAGPSFSSGGDLTEFGTMLDPVGAHAVRTTRSIPLSLLGSGARVTAYVHGRCIGAGAELPAFAGRVVAAPDATFLLPEVAMGLVPGAGGTASLPRRIGPSRAAYLILSGLPIDADQALAWGLVDEIAPRAGMPGAPRT